MHLVSQKNKAAVYSKIFQLKNYWTSFEIIY